MEKGLQTSPLITVGISAHEREDSQLGEELRSPHAVETKYPNVSLVFFFFFSARISSMQSSNKIPSSSTSSHVSGTCSFLITPVLSSATEMCLTWRYVAKEVGWVVSFGTERRTAVRERWTALSKGGTNTCSLWGHPDRERKCDFGFVHFNYCWKIQI